jgi:PAS domain S-box-containing protein
MSIGISAEGLGTGGFACRQLFDEVPCYISVQDRDFRVVEANRHFIDSFQGRIGGHCYQIYKKRDSRCERCPVAETFQDGQSHTSEELLIDSRGNQIHVAVHTAAIRDAQGSVAAVMEVFDDITEIRSLQDKLASLGGIVSGIAHSIKNVLEGMRGGVYIAKAGLRNNETQDIRTGCEMVERNLGRLSAMIMDMLYCAKDRAPRHLAVSIPAIAGEVLQMFSARAGEYGIKLESEISDGAGRILGEPKDIHSLISNLIGNAIDACLADQEGEKAYRVAVRVFDEPGHSVIEVQDNGAGMDQETRAKLFTEFYSTKGPHGTGLGLLVARKVAAEHGGSISVESAPGDGSTFIVRLPLESKGYDGST